MQKRRPIRYKACIGLTLAVMLDERGDLMQISAFLKTGALLVTVLLAGCALPLSHTGFLVKAPDAAPAAKSYLGPRPPLRIDNPRDKFVIVYSHGTTRPQKPEDCDAMWNRVPRPLLAMQSEKLLIYYLCSRALETKPDSVAMVGNYVYKRLEEVEATLDELIALGVPPRNIFLAGHSAGGWTSLMAMRLFGEKFNAAIVFAPAFAGPRSEEKRYPWWRRRARPRQIREMLEAPEIRALVFAYYGDPYETPEELKFLTERYAETVRIIAYACDIRNPHLVHLNDCQEAATTETIAEYIEQMTGG